MLSHFGVFAVCVRVCVCLSMRINCMHRFCVCWRHVSVIVYIMFSWSNKPLHASKKKEIIGGGGGFACPLHCRSNVRIEENATLLSTRVKMQIALVLAVKLYVQEVSKILFILTCSFELQPDSQRVETRYEK